MGILKDWNASHTQRFQKEVMSFSHGLDETGLFSDEALIELLERHPSHMLDVNSMGDAEHPEYPNKFRTGDFRDIPGKVLMDAAKAGRVFINMRNAMNIHPEYKAVLDNMYDGITDRTGKKIYKAKGGILISSPISQTPYHFDKTEVILWHIRGAKRIVVYPRTQKFIPDRAYEAAVTNLLDDDLPYDKSFDQEAKAIDLKPGMALSWPLNSPHRVDNSSFCVSVTTEYSTRQSSLKNAAMITNATLRHKFGMDVSYENDGEATRYLKSAFGQVLKKTGIAHKTVTKDMVTFTIDPKNPKFVVDVSPFERNFLVEITLSRNI